MECSNCGSSFAQAYKRVVNGVEKEVYLCEKCYQKIYTKSDAPEFFAHIFGDRASEPEQPKNVKVCPSCGMTYARFKNTGLLGCANCYTVFCSEIRNSVRYCQWDVKHSGKEPIGFAEEKYDMVRELARIQEQFKLQLDLAKREGDREREEKYRRRLQEIQDMLVKAGEE